MNVLECFERGFNGSGIKIVVLDDGLDFSHQDIYPNYVKKSTITYTFSLLKDLFLGSKNKLGLQQWVQW